MERAKEFLDYLIGLAPEGETALFLRQKPVGAEVQYHADGAPKATFPAFLPATALRKMKPDQAWYGNTGSYILDRMPDGPSAARANCEYCLCMILDDVGTKSKVPPLAPTWVMETSPGSFQWGYGFSEQPSKGEFAAAIKAIAAAGYTDPGAINPVRNFRLPGSINLKRGRGLFAARLVEFHPTREYTLEEICEALEVTPSEAEVEYKPIRVADNGGDDVFAWLMDRGLVYSRPNGEGWAGVQCPNHEQHTDGSPEGRYNPSVRAYCCLHGHCQDWDTAAFLTWVEEQGGPARESGLRDDLLAEIMRGTLSKLEPGTLFSEATTAAAAIAAADQREVGRTQKADWYKRFVYVQTDDSYFDLITRRELTRRAFDSTFRHIRCQSIHATGPNGGRLIQASTCFDENRQAMGARAVVGITYAAGEAELVERNGDVYCNRWRDGRPPRIDRNVSDKEIEPWLAHCRKLIPEAAALQHVLDVMAFKLQFPRVKINHAILHGGTQGCGKDTLWAPFLYAVCGPGLVNRGLMDGATLGSQFGYMLECEILILNELREPEARERRALANMLKPIIAAPPEMLSVNRKGLHPYDMLNRILLLAFTNDKVPISLESQDRRWFAIWSAAARMDPEAARALWDWYKAGGFQLIAGWLHQRDVSAFNPAATPMTTEWKQTMIEQGMSSGESFLVEMIRSGAGEFAKGAIASPFHSLCDRLRGAAPEGAKVYQGALLHAISEAGWVDVGRVMSAEHPTRKQVYCRPDLAEQLTKSELRRLVEPDATPPGLRVAK